MVAVGGFDDPALGPLLRGFAIGGGVGVAAAVALRSGVSVREVDIREVQKILRAMGEEP